jgi:DNA polymerase-1
MQLVDGKRVFMWDGKKNVVGPEHVKEKFGVDRTQLRDYLALAGDTVDGVPGVRGIGPAAAVELLAAYPDLDTMLKAALDVKATGFFKAHPRLRSMLRDQAEEAKLYQKLVTLRTDVPIKPRLVDFRYEE